MNDSHITNHIPFANFQKHNWVKLLTIVIILLFCIEKSIEVINLVNSKDVGVDFLSFWSAGKIANQYGYSEIYDIELLRNVQIEERKAIGTFDAENPGDSVPVPAPLFPVFILVFQLFSMTDAWSGYGIWTILNLLLFIGYLVWFSHQMKLEVPKAVLAILLFLLSVPVIENFTTGQVEVLLLVSAGEFLRLSVKKKPLWAGVWLGLMLLKPQILFLVIPSLILMKNWKAFAGFCIASAGIALSSLMIAGWGGMMTMVHFWFENSGTVNYGFVPEVMMNWRAAALLVNDAFGTWAGWILAGLGTMFTLYLLFIIIHGMGTTSEHRWVMVMLGVFLSSCIATWHAHVHMVIAVIPFLLYGLANYQLPKSRVIGWVVIPQAVWLVSLILVALEIASVLPDLEIHARLKGLSILAVNLGLLIYLYKRLKDTKYGQEKMIERASSKKLIL